MKWKLPNGASIEFHSPIKKEFEGISIDYIYYEEKEMTKEQEAHLLKIKQTFDKEVDKKYREGQKEHGGNLYEMLPEKLLDNAIDEALDLVVYLVTLRESIIVNRMRGK